jgi:protein-L-isoaspartate(D-aspartate) O-methyltransferase
VARPHPGAGDGTVPAVLILMNFSEQREGMVEHQIASRGVRDPRVLAAMRAVPREGFVPPEIEEFAYSDSPLGIGEGQTISQPYIVALMAEAAGLEGHERVLEIGTGSGYGAAVLGRLAAEVFTIERQPVLARTASRRLAEGGAVNVHVVEGDGTLGLPAHAPFDAIIVTAGGPKAPPALLDQLAVGGRMIIPVGENRETQTLLRVRRVSEGRFEEEELGAVRFVPLVGAQGWKTPVTRPAQPSLAHLIRETVQPLTGIEGGAFDALVERIGDARVVLLGEATHGTSEFYRTRAEITKRLICERGFRMVAVEADWPDASAVNRYVQALRNGHAVPGEAFQRFPQWMWRNDEMLAFVEWLRGHNQDCADRSRIGFYGLDLYSLFTSIRAVLDYLDRVDPPTARTARLRYSCLTAWEGDPATYGRAALTGRYRVCEKEAVAMLEELMKRRLEYLEHDGVRFLDAVANAKLITNAERYYRAMYYGSAASWNLRDRHMFDTLETLLSGGGPDARAVVWAHNSHLGDARATEMAARGEVNLGQLCRQVHGPACFNVGFGTDHGTVAAARDWDEPMRVMSVRPAHPLSYEHVFHDSGVPAFVLPLRDPTRASLLGELAAPRLERAIGVVYRPDTEVQSHYFQADLPAQFDAYIWFDETRAISPLSTPLTSRLPAVHPFLAA